MGISKVDFIDVEFDDGLTLDRYDTLYLNGGNPFQLLFHLRKSGGVKKFKELAENGTVLVGVSAGGLVLGPSIEIVQYFTPHLNTISIRDFSGVGVTDTIIFPHYDREELFPGEHTIEERIIKFENIYHTKITRLIDTGAIVINDDRKIYIK